MRSECKSCIHRNDPDTFCTKDNQMKQNEHWLCEKYKCDFSLKKEIKVAKESNRFSKEFIEKRARFGGQIKQKESLGSDWETFLLNGGGWSLNRKNPGRKI